MDETYEEATVTAGNPPDYTEDNIKTLEWNEHLRARPGMYIGKLGDGSTADDGIYVLLKEVLDNSIDEFMPASAYKIFRKELLFLCLSGRKDSAAGSPFYMGVFPV